VCFATTTTTAAAFVLAGNNNATFAISPSVQFLRENCTPQTLRQQGDQMSF
jgi:hypothetical protein